MIVRHRCRLLQAGRCVSDAAQALRTGDAPPELMTGGRFPGFPGHNAQSGLGRENTGRRVSQSVSHTRAAPETRESRRRVASRMARPGLEPGTPRFSDSRTQLSNWAENRANERVLAEAARGSEVRTLHAFERYVGHETPLVAR